MTRRLRPFGVACLAAVMMLTACSDSTGPGGQPFDPAHAEADIAALGTILDHPQLEAFNALSYYFSVGGTATAAMSSARAIISSGGTSPATVRRLAKVATEGLSLSASGGPSLEVLPPAVFGKTFEFDAETDQYVESDRTGAPANGVRFIIYAIDPLSGEPIVDTEVGHADLIDTSVGSQTTAGLRLLLVGGTTTYMDYAFSASGGINSAHLAVNGFLTDGTTRLNFGIGAVVVLGEEQLDIDVDYSLSVPSRSFSVAGSLDGSIGSGTSQADMSLTIVSGGTTVRYVITEDDATMSATVYVNGRIFATIAGDHDTPVIQGAEGAELTQEEIDALVELLTIADGIFEFFGMLMEPVNGVTDGGFSF